MINIDVIKIIFDKSIRGSVSLKELVHVDVFAFNLQIELLAGVKINLHDDVLELDDLANSKKIEHTIEFILNTESRLEYHMHLRPEDNFKSSPQSDCKFDKKLKLDFVGQHAFAKVRTTCLGLARQNFNFITEQNHFVGQTSSCLCIKSVLLDGASLYCKNKIFVHQGLQEVFARQINKNLLLGAQACVSTIPQLEVLSDNVKCKHGATVKALDEEQLCYLQSRGVSKSQAELLLIDGFLR